MDDGGFELSVVPGGGNTSGAKVLPFARKEIDDESQRLLVHFTVASDDPAVRQEVQRIVNDALREMRTVQGHKIVAVITREDVTMTSVSVRELAAHVVPVVKQMLGLPN
jgi:hypothetical protein